MAAWLVVSCASVAIAVFAGWLLPAWAMKRLMPSLERGGMRVTNFRGASIPTGLGIVWLVWAAGAAVVGALVSYVRLTFLATSGGGQGDVWSAALLTAPLRTILDALPLLLVVGAFGFGLVDDVFGDPSAKGFRGHLRALAGGRLTTGGLKLLGIGGLALAAALPLSQEVTAPDGRWRLPLTALVVWACAALVIALSANLVNLTDLRPGRALKVYSLMATIGVAIAIWPSSTVASAAFAFITGGGVSPALDLVWVGGMKLSLLAMALGPVVAVWRYDLGERAMLGDAGANAMGALAGFLLAWRSPLWLLALLAVVLVALNLASERVSFSAVIDRVRLLAWIDGLGRLPAGPAPVSVEAGNGEDGGARAGGSAAEDEMPRRDDVS